MYFVNMQSAGYAFSFMKVTEKGDIPLEGSYWIKGDDEAVKKKEEINFLYVIEIYFFFFGYLCLLPKQAIFL